MKLKKIYFVLRRGWSYIKKHSPAFLHSLDHIDDVPVSPANDLLGNESEDFDKIDDVPVDNLNVEINDEFAEEAMIESDDEIYSEVPIAVIFEGDVYINNDV